MEVILCEDVVKIGKAGEVVKVKDGFARNYLFPQKLAFEATKMNLQRIEQEKKKRQLQNEQDKQKAQELAEKLNKLSCTINVEVNDIEKLYGSVGEVDIVRLLEDEGFKIERRNIVLEKPIDELGIFEIGVKLHPEVTAKVRLWVTKK
jgi:large subunit ribosomal protein L9